MLTLKLAAVFCLTPWIGMTRMAVLAVVVLLVGCDLPSSPPDAGWDGLICRHNVEWPDSVYETDSTASCPYADSGSYPATLIWTQWISTRSSCSAMKPSDVMGGLHGIDRHFGCHRRLPSNPNVASPCVDRDITPLEVCL